MLFQRHFEDLLEAFQRPFDAPQRKKNERESLKRPAVLGREFFQSDGYSIGSLLRTREILSRTMARQLLLYPESGGAIWVQ